MSITKPGLFKANAPDDGTSQAQIFTPAFGSLTLEYHLKQDLGLWVKVIVSEKTMVGRERSSTLTVGLFRAQINRSSDSILKIMWLGLHLILLSDLAHWPWWWPSVLLVSCPSPTFQTNDVLVSSFDHAMLLLKLPGNQNPYKKNNKGTSWRRYKIPWALIWSWKAAPWILHPVHHPVFVNRRRSIGVYISRYVRLSFNICFWLNSEI